MTIFLDTTGTIDPAIINILLPPVTAGLAGYWEFSADKTLSLRNLVDPSRPILTEVGTPTYSSSGVALSGSNGLITDVADSATWSRIIIARATAPDVGVSSTLPSYVGNFVSGQGGAILYNMNGGGTLSLSAFTNPSEFRIFDISAASWRTLGHRFTATQHKVHNFTSGVSSQGSASAYTPVARPVRLGGNGGWPGAFTLLAVALYSTSLSDADEATMQTWMRARAALRGVTA